MKLKFQFQTRVSTKVIATGIAGGLALIIIAQTGDQTQSAENIQFHAPLKSGLYKIIFKIGEVGGDISRQR